MSEQLAAAEAAARLQLSDLAGRLEGQLLELKVQLDEARQEAATESDTLATQVSTVPRHSTPRCVTFSVASGQLSGPRVQLD